MRKGLPMMVWALVWTIVVAVATASVWLVISRAGAHITNPDAPKLPIGSTVTPTPRTTHQATPQPTSEATHRPTSRHTQRPTPRATPSDTATESPAAVAVQGSWSGQAGRVTATCRAQKIRLDAAVPADGFTVEIGNRGPETLEVEFHQNRGGERESHVRGVCHAGGPSFAVEED